MLHALVNEVVNAFMNVTEEYTAVSSHTQCNSSHDAISPTHVTLGATPAILEIGANTAKQQEVISCQGRELIRWQTAVPADPHQQGFTSHVNWAKFHVAYRLAAWLRRAEPSLDDKGAFSRAPFSC